MPKCDFYADMDDHRGLLEWLFADGSCEVYELVSSFEKPLQRFDSANEVLAQFEKRYITGKKWDTVYLQLYVLDAGPPFLPKKVTIDLPRNKGATYRYEAEGWGLIQFYLGGPSEDGLQKSHTSHNTQKKAEAWYSAIPDLGKTEAWDFKKITSFSSRLNREIKKRSVGKLGSLAVMTGAEAFWHEGKSLVPDTKYTGTNLVETHMNC